MGMARRAHRDLFVGQEARRERSDVVARSGRRAEEPFISDGSSGLF